jgi:hypothetical protein
MILNDRVEKSASPRALPETARLLGGPSGLASGLATGETAVRRSCIDNSQFGIVPNKDQSRLDATTDPVSPSLT